MWARVLPALRCVCKFELLVKPRYVGTPLEVHRQRWDHEGEYIPRKYRAMVFV